MNPEMRKKGIGGSEAAIIVGETVYGRDQFGLWAEKKGWPMRNGESTLAQDMGHIFEPGMLQVYGKLTGREVDHCTDTFQHRDYPYLIASPDGFCRGERRGVEVKIPANPGEWQQWGREADEIPIRVTIQCLHYMEFFDMPYWDVIALVNMEPRLYVIQRDRPAGRVLRERIREWWERYIVGDEQPPLGSTGDAARWLQMVYPTHKRPDMRQATEEEAALLRAYVALRAHQKQLDVRQEEMETEIKAAIQDREGLKWGDGAFTWRKSKDSEITNWEALSITLLPKDEDARRKLIADHSYTKPGVRRIHVNHPLLREKVRSQ